MLDSFGITLTSFSREQKQIFLTLSISYITMICPETLIAPFFPSEARKHGVSSSLTGTVIGASAAVGLISSPFIGAIIAVKGPKRFMITAMVLNGVFSVLFGLLEHFKSTQWFAVGSFICIGFMSFGNATIFTAILTYAAKLFPDHFNLVTGMIELYMGIAEVIALLPGAFLHEIGGFKLPFIVFGCLHLFVIPVNLFLLPTDDKLLSDSKSINSAPSPLKICDENKGKLDDNLTSNQPHLKIVNCDSNLIMISSLTHKPLAVPPVLASVPVPGRFEENKDIIVNNLKDTNPTVLKKKEEEIDTLRLWHLIKIPRTMIMAFVFMLTSVCWSFLNYTLEPHLSPLDLTKTQTNMLFLLTSLVFGISCPICGWIADHIKKTWIMVTVGLVLSGLTFGFIGPLPFLGLQNTVWLNIVCLTVLTVAINISGIPAIGATLLYTIEVRHKNNIETYAIVSSLISTVNFAGIAIGSFTGGVFLDRFGYPHSAGLYGIVCLISGCAILSYFIACHNKATPQTKKSLVTFPEDLSLQFHSSKLPCSINQDLQLPTSV